MGSSNSVESKEAGVTFKVNYHRAIIINDRDSHINVRFGRDDQQMRVLQIAPGDSNQVESDPAVCTSGKEYTCFVEDDRGNRLVKWQLKGHLAQVFPPRGHLWIETERGAKKVADVKAKTEVKHKTTMGGTSHAIGMTAQVPSVRLPKGLKPDADCERSVLGAAAVLKEVGELPHIVMESKAIAKDRLRRLPDGATRLDLDGAVALAIYSYDLGLMSLANGEDNFYVVFNEKLRARQKEFLARMRNYCYFLFTAMETLPPFQGVVFRGLPASAIPIVQENYVTRAEIFWSAVTSTSTDIEVAKENFAGPGGVVFRIDCGLGRNIKDYSALPNEQEIILSPNSKFVVIEGCRESPDGFFYVDMLQIEGCFVF